MSQLNGFNRVADFYDSLKRLVFGRSISRSQVHFLKLLEPKNNVLIIGGGSGEIIRALLEQNPRCSVWFVEASSRMLQKAAKVVNDADRPRVTFIHGTEDELPGDEVFDGVITHFFLDLFPKEKCRDVCNGINTSLKANGLWLVADFVDGGRLWQRMLLGLMYVFFRFMCKIEARSLPPWQTVINETGLREINRRHFYSGFIKSAVYCKTN